MPQCEDNPPSLEDIAADVTENCTTDRIDSFNSKLSFSDSLIHELEKSRKHQSSFHNWWSQRKGCITASRFHEFNQKVQTLYKNCLKPVKCRILTLLLRIVEPKELKNVESLEWGKKNEKNAAESFMKVEGKKHTNPKLLSYGLYLFKPHSYIGATPDNILKCECCPISCIE